MAKKATDRTAIREIAAPFVEARTAGELSEASARVRRSLRRGEVTREEVIEAGTLLSPGPSREMLLHALTEPSIVVVPKTQEERIARHRARVIESERAPEKVILRHILEVLVDLLEKK